MNTPTLSLTLVALAIASVVASGCGGAEGSAAGAGPEPVFSRMEEAIRGSNASLFQAQWHPQGYAENLVGGSGLPGSRVYEQGARKKWYLKPELAKARTVEGVTIVPADVWSWERDRSVDRLDVAIVVDGGRPLVLGAGEDGSQVDALARRYAKREPLAPPK